MKGNCEYCGKEFDRSTFDLNRYKYSFCSPECNYSYDKKTHVNCSNCGKDFTKNKYNLNRSKLHFCNIICHNEYKEKNNSKKVNCQKCGKEFKKKKSECESKPLHFCSQECYFSQRDKMVIGNKNPMFGRTHSEETKIILSKQKIDALTPEVIQRLKDQRMKQVFPIKDTKPEVKLQGFLNELHIEFEKHKQMSIPHTYQCDILVPSLNLVIEADGNHWHNFPIGNDIDHTRTQELKEAGYNVLRLWESEIKLMCLFDFELKLKQFGDEKDGNTTN